MPNQPLTESIGEWLAHPYKGEDMSAFEWFLFLALIFTLSGLWALFVRKLFD